MLDNDYVLVIPSWYPSERDAFNGDFNQRTIDALSYRKKQVVVYVVGIPQINKIKVKSVSDGHVDINIAYYSKSVLPIIGKFLNFLYYLLYNHKIINNEIKRRGCPLYIHTYVFFPAGLISWYFAKKYRLKNVLSEHWTAFYNYSKQSLSSEPFFLRFLFKRILNSFDLILPVADALGAEMKKWNQEVLCKTIPNVVNTDYFNFNAICKHQEFTFLHVSTMSFQKNPEMLLDAFEAVLMKIPVLKLNLIGPSNDDLKHRVSTSDSLRDAVKFLGEMDNKSVAREMKKCHSLILNSRFENLPCVILEALCCGLPVVSSDVGGVSEILTKDNGLIFAEGNRNQLIQSILIIYQSYKNYNLAAISETAIQKYSYEAVADKTWQILETINIYP